MRPNRKERRLRYKPPEQTPGGLAELGTALTRVKEVPALLDLEKLVATKEALDAATEQLNLALARVEAALIQQAHGRCAAVEMELSMQRGEHVFKVRAHWALLFWHFDGDWGLYTLNTKGKMQRLAHAPRNVRVAACAVLEDLWNQLQYEEEEVPA